AAFLFALYPMNVFQFVPLFVLGLVLGVLATRSGSVVPGLTFHLLYAGLLLALAWLRRQGGPAEDVAAVLHHPAQLAASALGAALLTLRAGAGHTAPVWASEG